MDTGILRSLIFRALAVQTWNDVLVLLMDFVKLPTLVQVLLTNTCVAF
jgi:hypothetical protein